MLTVKTIRKIRLSIKRDGKFIRQTARDLRLSRSMVRKVIRSDETAFHYKRRIQPRPKLRPLIEGLERRLEEDERLPERNRRTAQILFEELEQDGYMGGYDSVRRYVKYWRRSIRSCLSRYLFPLYLNPERPFSVCIAYPQETQEMVFDGHIRAFEVFGWSAEKDLRFPLSRNLGVYVKRNTE